MKLFFLWFFRVPREVLRTIFLPSLLTRKGCIGWEGVVWRQWCVCWWRPCWANCMVLFEYLIIRFVNNIISSLMFSIYLIHCATQQVSPFHFLTANNKYIRLIATTNFKAWTLVFLSKSGNLLSLHTHIFCINRTWF